MNKSAGSRLTEKQIFGFDTVSLDLLLFNNYSGEQKITITLFR